MYLTYLARSGSSLPMSNATQVSHGRSRPLQTQRLMGFFSKFLYLLKLGAPADVEVAVLGAGGVACDGERD